MNEVMISLAPSQRSLNSACLQVTHVRQYRVNLIFIAPKVCTENSVAWFNLLTSSDVRIHL